jgi:uncharacterized protein
MYVIMLENVPGRDASIDLIRRHIQHIRTLDEDGRLVLCGPFTDHPGGMIIVQVEHRAEALAIAAADPFVREGVRTCEVRTWQIGNAENNYLDPDG